MKKALYFLAVALALCVIVDTARWAHADQDNLGSAGSLNATRSCSFENRRAQKVTVTSSSAATATAPPPGVVRIMCTTDVHMYQALTGVSAPTAGVGDTLIGQWTPEYVLNYGSQFAFIRDTADGTCYVTECK